MKCQVCLGIVEKPREIEKLEWIYGVRSAQSPYDDPSHNVSAITAIHAHT